MTFCCLQSTDSREDLSSVKQQYVFSYMMMNQLMLVQGFIVMPFLCYYLQVHDCMIAILGIVVLISLPTQYSLSF